MITACAWSATTVEPKAAIPDPRGRLLAGEPAETGDPAKHSRIVVLGDLADPRLANRIYF